MEYIFLKGEAIKKEDLDLYQVLSELYQISLVNDVIFRYLKVIMNLFFLQNINYVDQMFLRHVKSLFGIDLFFEPKIHLNKNQVIDCMVGYLEKLDNIDKIIHLKDNFLMGLAQGNIFLYDKDDDQERESIEKNNGFPIGILDVAKCFHYNHQLFINVPLTGTLEDVYTVVHEFFHKYYYCSNGYSFNGNFFNDRLVPFSEFPSIFFESYLASHLIELGYLEEEVLATHNFRKHNNISIYSNNLQFMGLIKKILLGEKIVFDDFVYDYTELIVSMKKIFTVLDESQKKLIQKLERLTENKDVVAKRNCNDFLKKIMFDFYKIYDSHSYLFSDILTNYLLNDSKNSVAWMLRFSQDMFALEMDPTDIVRLLFPAHVSILFQHSYKESGIKKIPMLVKNKK